jgi:carboxymethylenebutenolidase
MKKIERTSGLRGVFLPLHGARTPGPAIIIAPTIAGIDDYILRVAHRLNEAGYAVFMIDYYKEGCVPDLGTMPKILEAVAALSDTEVICHVQAAMELLLERADIDGDRIATLGFCVGGTFSFLSGCQVEGLAASTVYYGMLNYPATTSRKPLSPISAAGDLKVPMIGHFGELDRFVPVSDVTALRTALAASERTFEIFVYPGAPHAFDEDFRAPYRPVAAREAWIRTICFLDWHIGIPRTSIDDERHIDSDVLSRQ